MARRCVLCALPVLALAGLLLVPEPSFAQFRGYRGGYGYYGGYNPAGYGSYGYPGYGYSSYGSYSPSYYGGMSPYYGYGGSAVGSYTNPQPYAFSSPYYNNSGLYYSNPQPYNYSSPAYYNGGYTTVAPAAGVQAYQSGYPSGTPPTGTPAAGVMPDSSKRTAIHVHVPADAQVFVDGTATRQTGPDRNFITPPLDRSDYTYDVTARWMDNGKERRESRTVRLIPGQTVNLDFTSADNPPERRGTDTPPPTPNPKTPPENSKTPLEK